MQSNYSKMVCFYHALNPRSSVGRLESGVGSQVNGAEFEERLLTFIETNEGNKITHSPIMDAELDMLGMYRLGMNGIHFARSH